MQRTKHEITTTYGPGRIRHTVTVPAGTRVKPSGDMAYFVDDLSWLPAGDTIERHDATYYGIRIGADDIEEVK